jgi:hypothetical protein
MIAADNLSTPEDCISLYERGFEGAWKDPAAEIALADQIAHAGGYRTAFAAIAGGGFQGTGEGKLSIPFLAMERLYPGCLPGGSQQRGDCVSWSLRSAAATSYASSLWWGDNHERFGGPRVSAAARESGVFSTEVFYWNRGHGGEGWNGPDAARVALTKAGLIVRKDYPEIGINLERYSGSLAGKWGASPPPQKIIDVTSQHLLQTATICKDWEDVRDMLANGYACMTTGREAFSSERDKELGLCKRSNQTWMHAMSFLAADDREEVKRKAGCRVGGLVLVQNSWSNYCGDSFPIYGTKYQIPPGSFWARWDDVRDRYIVAIGGAKGFVASPVERWSLSSIL